MLQSHFNKVAGLEACEFIKKRFQRWCFLMNISQLYFEQNRQTSASGRRTESKNKGKWLKRRKRKKRTDLKNDKDWLKAYGRTYSKLGESE